MGTPRSSPEDQTAAVIDRLEEAYPEVDISLDYEDRFQLLVSVILSAQCTDERVNAVTEDLFEKYRSPEDVAAVDEAEFAEDIGSITYPNQKAGWITDAAERIVEEYGGEVPDSMDALTDLPGVGRKTANVVLQHGHGVVEGIAVDTHVMRLARRLGLTEAERRDRIEADLMDLVPEDRWRVFTHLLIEHGRAVCTARNPDCEACELEDLCPSSRLDSAVDLADGEPWNDQSQRTS